MAESIQLQADFTKLYLSVFLLGTRGLKASGSEERANSRKKTRDKKRGGYCECCVLKYENLTSVSGKVSKGGRTVNVIP